MYCHECFRLPSIAIIAGVAVAVTILWLRLRLLFSKREIQGTVTAKLTDNSAAATSSSSSSVVYEVFLSFCGKDTRNGFTDFLYTYLVGASVLTFRDHNELRVGEEISSELLKAIKECKISIPIFSKNYASSKWCLLELVQMVKCYRNGGHMIYPIFYDIDPSDVQNQRGSYEKAFRQHKRKYKEETVQSWREALGMVGELKGLELTKETGGREGELVKIVVEKVLIELKKNYTHVPKNLVGMDNHIENLKELLKVESNDVRIIGIHGMGGLGKTTIAKVIYNQLCPLFESHCFLDNVRESSKHRNGIVDLQKQLISKIQNREVSELSDINEGSTGFKYAVRGKKVLLVLDDVDESFQVDMLMGNQSWFGAQSRIIITTRDRNVLDAIDEACRKEDLHDVYASYKPDFMDDSYSLELFSKYAFMRDSPVEGYDILSKEVVSIAAGLPLVLVVLGSTFFVVKGKDLWEEKLRKLRAIPHIEVLEKLRFSFEVLEHEQKQIFLDIACLFLGTDKAMPSYMWEDCGFYPKEAISVLVSRSLITVSDDNKLIMHDQLRDLGRQIVREESLNDLGKRSRLWCEEEAMCILETHRGTSSVSALCLPSEVSDSSEDLASCLVASDFHDLPNIRYLILGTRDLNGDFKHLLSNLRWLQWRCSGKFEINNLHLKNLVILNLSDCQFTEDWEGWSQIKIVKKLKVLYLLNCPHVRFVPYLSTFSSLEILMLGYCKSLCRLDGLQQLKSLRRMEAFCCEDLETLPSLSNLTKLVYLNLAGCRKLINIQGLDKLESLHHINICRCKSLERLPTVSNLKILKTIKARGCYKLIEIEGLQGLNSLEHLDLRYCSSLEGVPDLSNLHNLKVLLAPYLEMSKILPNFSNLKKLKALTISFSDNLIEFQGQDRSEQLEYLNIVGGSIKRLPDLLYLMKLKKLSIRYCEQLIEIQDLGGLECLEYVNICYCPSIERLPDLSNLRKLKGLVFQSCKNLIELQGLDKLKSLKSLRIRGCPSLDRLPDLPNFGVIKAIEVESCDKLHGVEGLGVIESLESLVISNCYKLKEIPDLRSLKNLKALKICSLKELTEIQGLEELKCLESLDISGCKLIEALPDFSNSERLTDLDVSGCVKLTQIQGLEEMKSLKILSINGCRRLRNLPNLPNTMIQHGPTFNVSMWNLLREFGLTIWE